VRLFMVDSVIFERAWDVFSEDEHPHWTFTDCINYSVIQYLGLQKVMTFDPGFKARGISIIP
jgi:predicted nucleic acid-binding protein